jgi:hypothetical protein
LACLSAFWQLVVVLQFKILLRCLGLDLRAQWLGVLGWFAFFGTSLFGIRYYALSSTPLALLGMYAALFCVHQGFRNRREWIAIPALAILMQLNHSPQELGNFLLGAVVLVLANLWPESLHPRRKEWSIGGAILVIGGVGLGWALEKFHPAWYTAYAQTHSVTFWGGASVGSDVHRIQSTLGLHGLLGFLSTVFLWKRHRAFAALCFAPLFFLLYPPTCFVLMQTSDPSQGVLYRVFYMFPTSIALVIAVYEFFKARVSLAAALMGALCVIVPMGLVFRPPVYGRLFFQLYRQDPKHTLQHLDSTAHWFVAQKKEKMGSRYCRLLADDVTYFVLATHLGLPLYGASRLVVFRDLIEANDVRKEPLKYFHELRICRVLLPQIDQIPPYAEPFIGNVSGHWRAALVDQRTFVPKNFKRLQRILKQARWKSSPVPPYFDLWEVPNGEP